MSGFACLAKYAGMFIPAGILVVALVRHDLRLRLTELMVKTAVWAAILAPNIIWNFSNGFLTFFQTKKNIGWMDANDPLGTLDWVELLDFLGQPNCRHRSGDGRGGPWRAAPFSMPAVSGGLHLAAASDRVSLGGTGRRKRQLGGRRVFRGHGPRGVGSCRSSALARPTFCHQHRRKSDAGRFDAGS